MFDISDVRMKDEGEEGGGMMTALCVALGIAVFSEFDRVG